MSKQHRYCLYLIDDIYSDSITTIVGRLNKSLSELHGENYVLAIKNIFKNGNAESAINDGVFSIPTLVKLFPEPKKCAVGDLNKTSSILLSLLDNG